MNGPESPYCYSQRMNLRYVVRGDEGKPDVLKQSDLWVGRSELVERYPGGGASRQLLLGLRQTHRVGDV
jgi:hypothetical protein